MLKINYSKTPLEIDGKIYLNLQEQVLKNHQDLEHLKQVGVNADLGIKIINASSPLVSPTLLPTNYDGEYGDGYIVGTAIPYELYIWSRDGENNGFWFDWGLLNAPSTIEGPQGIQGEIGPQGTRGSLWNSQSGAPTNTVDVNDNDQALDTSNGNVYQFVDGSWELVGNIRGPKGEDSVVPGPQGPQGIQGERGFKGDKGDTGQFITILGTLENTSQLPMPDTVERFAAYLIPDSTGNEHIWLLVGEGTAESPIIWHDAGAVSNGSGTSVTFDGVGQQTIPLDYVPKISINYQIGDDTNVTSNGSEVTFSSLQTSGQNALNDTITGLGVIELPIASSEDIQTGVTSNTLQFSLTDAAWNKVQEMVDSAAPLEVQITAPTTSTNGSLTQEQLETLQANSGAYLMFNNEIYRLQDTQHISGYLVYTHIGFDNTTDTYVIKCITVTINTRGWVLTVKEIHDLEPYVLASTTGTIPADDFNNLINNPTIPILISSTGALYYYSRDYEISGSRIVSYSSQYLNSEVNGNVLSTLGFIPQNATGSATNPVEFVIIDYEVKTLDRRYAHHINITDQSSGSSGPSNIYFTLINTTEGSYSSATYVANSLSGNYSQYNPLMATGRWVSSGTGVVTCVYSSGSPPNITVGVDTISSNTVYPGTYTLSYQQLQSLYCYDKVVPLS